MTTDEIRQSMAEPLGRGISRRRLLGITGAAAATAVAGKLGIDWLSSLNKVEVEEPETDPQGILEGNVRIFVGSTRLRKDPSKLDVFEKDKDGRNVNVNLVSWSQIDTLNRVSLIGHNEFFIENPEIVWGYNPDGSGKQDGRWIRLRAVRNWPLLGDPQKKKESYLYLSISEKTEEGVQTEFSSGKTHKVQKVEGDTIITDGKPFKKAEVGKITFSDLPKAA